MDLLARIALELGAVGTLDCGLILLTQLTHDMIRIHGFLLDGCSHHPSSVVNGEILNSLQRNLERTMALWTLDFPAAAAAAAVRGGGCTPIE